jgi:hypothetical protein
MSIHIVDYLMGRGPVSDELMRNAEELLEKIELLEHELDLTFVLSSGYRPPAVTDSIAGAHHGDAHESCQGIDIHDPDLLISKELQASPGLLEKCGLYLESPISSANHCHLQSRPPKSGKRVFLA